MRKGDTCRKREGYKKSERWRAKKRQTVRNRYIENDKGRERERAR